MSTDSLLYESIQRLFRNAVVSHLRLVLRSKYPDDWQDRVKRPFKKEEWEGIESSVDRIKAVGGVEVVHEDALDYLGVNHFFNLFDAYFLDVIPADELPSDAYIPKLRQQVLGWLREIRVLRDPLSHPASEDLALPDALRTVDSANRLLRLLHQPAALATNNEIYGELLQRASAGGAIPDLPPAVDTLPPRETIVLDFVGRQRELLELWKWFMDPQQRRWLISGDGGKGKSALAFRFASDVRIAPPDPICGVFWLSAKKRRYDEGGVVEIANPDFWDLDSALNKLLLDYGARDDILKTTDAKRLMMLELLNDLPCLIIVDDLDSIPAEDESVVEFFTLDAARSRSKVLITSRRHFGGMGQSRTVVEGLSGPEALSFVESRKRMMGFPDAALTSKQTQQIIDLCEGSPLYMEDLLRLCLFVPIPEAIASWRSKGGEGVRTYALSREIEMLTPPAREILRVCAVADGSLTVLEFEKITGRQRDTIKESIEELRRMYLVPAPELLDGVPRFQINRNLKALIRSGLEGTPEQLRIRNAIRAVYGEEIAPAYAGRIGDYVRQSHILSESRQHEESERTLNKGLEEFPNHPRLLSSLGLVYSRWKPHRRAVDARAAWERAYQLGSRDRTTYYYWCSAELSEERWIQAAAAADKGLEMCGARDPEFLQLKGYASSRLGQALRAQFNYDRAERELKAADHHFRQAVREAHNQRPFDRGLISRCYRGWVLNAQWRQDVPELCRRLREWLGWNPEDSYAIHEVRRQALHCPEVASLLAREGT